MNYRQWTDFKGFSVFHISCSIFLCLFVAIPVSVFAQNDLLDEINAHINRLESRYQISFKYANFPAKSNYLKFVEVPESEYQRLNDYLALFEQEINKYPPGFFKDQDVRGVGIVMRLFGGERSAQGIYSGQVGVMFFDIYRFGKNKAQQRHSIHHEIFHMMVEKKGDVPLLSDETWGAFNDPDFLYGGQKRIWKGPNPYNYYAPNQPGFVTYYAMESIVEDQAEVFACLMQEKHRGLIEQWALKDEILAKKIKAIKEFSKYYHPQMDESYWQ